DHELVDAAGLEDLHDVPQDGPAADLDHRLRLDRRLLGQPRAEPACQYHCLHALTSPAAPRAPLAPPPPASLTCPASRVRRSSMSRPGGSSTSWYVTTSSLATSRFRRQPSATPIGSSPSRSVSAAVSHWP